MTAKTIKPNFSHRYDGDLVDSVGMMTERATAILHTVMIQFESDKQSRCSDAIIHAALSAVAAEIQDIEAAIAAFHEGQKQA